MVAIYEIAEAIRKTPFHTLTDNCLIKSFRFKKRCRKQGIKAYVVISFGFAPVKWGVRLAVPIVHGWAEVDGRRIEVARSLYQKSLWGTFDKEIKPVFAIWV